MKTFTADPKATFFTGPVVALIDTGTAGAAEVVASALIERNRGQVVGEKSFGAGTEQQLFSLARRRWTPADHREVGELRMARRSSAKIARIQVSLRLLK